MDDEPRNRRASTGTTYRWDERTARRQQRGRGGLLNDPRMLALALVALLALVIIGGVWLLSGRTPPEQPLSMPPTSAATSRPTATPRPSPAPTSGPARATIARLGGGPGYLHEAPAFDSPVLSPVLKEGDTVELLDRAKTDAQGTAWQLVAFGDIVGWSPENNLDPAP